MKTDNRKFFQTGFSLIEVMMSITVVAMICGLGFWAYKVAQGRNNLVLATNSVVSDFRRAQLLSQSVSGDSQWGIRIQNNSVIVFRGSSYASRTTSFDETLSLPSGITTSGISEVVFSKLYGYPTTTGTISLTGSGKTNTITINSKGVVTY